MSFCEWNSEVYVFILCIYETFLSVTHVRKTFIRQSFCSTKLWMLTIIPAINVTINTWLYADFFICLLQVFRLRKKTLMFCVNNCLWIYCGKTHTRMKHTFYAEFVAMKSITDLRIVCNNITLHKMEKKEITICGKTLAFPWSNYLKRFLFISFMSFFVCASKLAKFQWIRKFFVFKFIHYSFL